jgi:hypothetical protein
MTALDDFEARKWGRVWSVVDQPTRRAICAKAQRESIDLRTAVQNWWPNLWESVRQCRAYVGDCYRHAASPADAPAARQCSRFATATKRNIHDKDVALCAQHARQWGTGRLVLMEDQ